MDSQLCASPMKSLHKNTDKSSTSQKLRNVEKQATLEKEENENTLANDLKGFKRALPAGLAESFRAVFAAFLWHEGLVHDAMASSTYLKFHPSLPKRSALTFANDEAKTESVPLSK